MRTISVKVQSDHLERLASVKSPTKGIIELIWNSLDADATEVNIVIDKNLLGGTQAIRIEDNGHGLPYQDAISAFENLGGSLKRHSGKTRGGRLLHGKLGKGRFAAFAAGERVEWCTNYLYTPDGNGGSKTLEYSITGERANLGTFVIGDEQEVSSQNGRMCGTTVTLLSLLEPLPSFNKPKTVQILVEEFALYLRQYPNVRIYFDGTRINPAEIEEGAWEYTLDAIRLESGNYIHATLLVIEWTIPMERALCLCDEAGFTLLRIPPGIQVTGFNFTAYLKSEFIKSLDNEGRLLLENLDPELRKVLAKTRDRLREHFRYRSAELTIDMVQGWKEDEIYPYVGDPRNSVEIAERQMFDVLALNVSSYLPEFESSEAKSKRFIFRLMKEALESNPSSIQHILQDVLHLPKEKQDELAKLLDKTSLEAIINASKLVADRLDFLEGLEILVFDPQSREQLLERRHLHRILAEHTWIFGEEFNLSLSDRSLTAVLKKHLADLSKDVLDESPVTRADGSTGIVDLMLSRSIPQSRATKREHLIIELKRPKVDIDDAVATQVRSYAFAIAADERFRGTETRWVYWAISNDLSDSVRLQANQRGRPEGLLFEDIDGQIAIWVKTWGHIIDECKARLRFFQQQLQYQADETTALEYLRKTHEKYLPPVLKQS